MLTAERLRELLRYDPETGVFTWKVSRGTAQAGDRAGGAHNMGYRHIGIDGARYLEHRLAWYYTHGEWPPDQIDHDNRTRCDSRIANLRPATNAENQQNLSARKDNTSGHPGVSWNRGKWRAYINLGGRRKHLGGFTDLEEAAEAYRIAKAKLHTFNPETRTES